MFWCKHCLNKFLKKKKGAWGKPKPNQPNKKPQHSNCSQKTKKDSRDQISALAELIMKLQKNKLQLWHATF